jgi:hypothetical protein
MNIQPTTEFYSSHLIANISGYNADDISAILGFVPNASADDDLDKVKYSWRFTLDGKPCAIWDYRGSSMWNVFSAWGDLNLLIDLFGRDHVDIFASLSSRLDRA